MDGDIFIFLGSDFSGVFVAALDDVVAFSGLGSSTMVTIARTGAAVCARRAPQIAERDNTGHGVNESAGTKADMVSKVSNSRLGK